MAGLPAGVGRTSVRQAPGVRQVPPVNRVAMRRGLALPRARKFARSACGRKSDASPAFPDQPFRRRPNRGRAGYAPRRAHPGRSLAIPLPARLVTRHVDCAVPAARFLFVVSTAGATRAPGPGSPPDDFVCAILTLPGRIKAARVLQSNRSRQRLARSDPDRRPRPTLPAPPERVPAARPGPRARWKNARRRG